MRVVSFGGGTDSTGVLCGWVEKGLHLSEPIDHILFADTGGERPGTYAHVQLMSEWLIKQGMPAITTVRKGGNGRTLEEDCLVKNMLPSLAYGRKGCSLKFKVQPQEAHLNKLVGRNFWKMGFKVEKLIGYEFNETRRWMAAKLEDDKYTYRFPLVEWQWTREDCVAAIQRAGLPLPGKSACFFCPASKKKEIDALKTEHPLLYQRALRIEDKARLFGKLDSVKGLGRSFSWRDYASAKEDDASVCMVCVDGA